MKIYIVLAGLLIATSANAQHSHISIVLVKDAHPREKYGADRLETVLVKLGNKVSRSGETNDTGKVILVGTMNSSSIKTALRKAPAKEATLKREGYRIFSLDNSNIVVAGADDSGVLYGCLELADRIKEQKRLPEKIDVTDHPEMVLRGACIGLQKTTYLPGRTVYEYPYTPESFPWFYDKQLWIEYLDMLVTNRMNSLYLWNGHPFASLVKLKDYPYAVEVDDETFRKNEEMFRFLTEEANKRGIWVIQMFYNIIVSKPFAERHQLKTQDRERRIVPVIADYTRKSIAAFMEKYPNVGLLITLGEAMQDEDDIEWFTKTIIPGVKDGLQTIGQTAEPPIVLRAHDSNPQSIMEAALPLYKNLYTMAKYNGEALTTYTPRGPWAAMHRELSQLGTVHIDNVHILANLEPFRYGSPDFIQRCVQAMHDVHGANGLHLYPQASYWDWPFTADRSDPRLLQIDRDWIWYKAWGRYSWDCRRNRKDEIKYWSTLLDNKFDCGVQAAEKILEAYEKAGEITPKLLRRFGITNGNRQTLTLGMFMSQLVNPYKYRVWKDLYDSDGPEGEMLIEYAEKESKGEAHTGETPLQIINEVVEHGRAAVEAINQASQHVKSDQLEFSRLKNDMLCHEALADFYSEKVKAALFALRYKYSQDLSHLDSTEQHLSSSVEHFRKLAALTDDFYWYANSMQTQQRKIPVGGNDGRNKTWTELLPLYEKELENFRNNLRTLRSNSSEKADISGPLRNADVKLIGSHVERMDLHSGVAISLEKQSTIKDIAAELKGLKAVTIFAERQLAEGTQLTFRNKRAVKVLIGFFVSTEKKYLQEPDLETNASADDRGQTAVLIRNAIDITGYPPVNVHGYEFKSGTNTLQLGKGICLVMGFVNADQTIPIYDAGFGVEKGSNIDWLFE